MRRYSTAYEQTGLTVHPPIRAALTANGVRIEGGIQEQPWGRFVTFDDPDGNGIVLQETSVGA